MKYQKMINLLDDTTNETSKFRTRNWVKINDELIGTCNAGNQVKFKTLMIRSNLLWLFRCIHIWRNYTVPKASAEGA